MTRITSSHQYHSLTLSLFASNLPALQILPVKGCWFPLPSPTACDLARIFSANRFYLLTYSFSSFSLTLSYGSVWFCARRLPIQSNACGFVLRPIRYSSLILIFFLLPYTSVKLRLPKRSCITRVNDGSQFYLQGTRLSYKLYCL